MILQSVIKKKLLKKSSAPARIETIAAFPPCDVTTTNAHRPRTISSTSGGGVGVGGRRRRRCCQLSMMDILRFHNEFHFSLHLQDHLRFSMGNFEGRLYLSFFSILYWMRKNVLGKCKFLRNRNQFVK